MKGLKNEKSKMEFNDCTGLVGERNGSRNII